MFLIVGLGNPEDEYAKTRHNMGFNAVNEIAKKYEIDISRSKFNGLYGSGIIENEKVILLKPQTYMNSSGESIIEFMNFYKLDLDNLIIIYDDIDIEPGKIKIRKNGSPGSHNGMKSVVHCLATDNFKRVRIGIGKPKENKDLIEHVIGAIDDEDLENLTSGVNKAKEAVIEILKNGVDSAMNKYN